MPQMAPLQPVYVNVIHLTAKSAGPRGPRRSLRHLVAHEAVVGLPPLEEVAHLDTVSRKAARETPSASVSWMRSAVAEPSRRPS